MNKIILWIMQCAAAQHNSLYLLFWLLNFSKKVPTIKWHFWVNVQTEVAYYKVQKSIIHLKCDFFHISRLLVVILNSMLVYYFHVKVRVVKLFWIQPG